MATDTNYLGLGVIFRAVDDGFSRTMESAKGEILSTSTILDGLQGKIDKFSGTSTVDIRVSGESLAQSATDLGNLRSFLQGIHGSAEQVTKEFVNSSLAVKNLGFSLSKIRPLDAGQWELVSQQIRGLNESVAVSGMDFGNTALAARSLGDSFPDSRRFAGDFANTSLAVRGLGDSFLDLQPAANGKWGLVSREFQGLGKSVAASGMEFAEAGGYSDDLRGEFNRLATEKDKLIANFGKLDSQLVKTQGQLDRTTERSQKTKGIFGRLGNGLHTLGKDFLSLKILSDSKPLQTFLTGTQDIPEYVKGFDNLQQKMARIYDPKMVQEFSNANLSNLRNFGVGADEATRMASSLNQARISLQEQKAILPTMGQMVGVLGMNADQVASMFGRSSQMLRMQPKEMVGVVKEVTKMGQAYKLLDFTDDLPDVVESVSDSLFKLGRMNRDNAKQAISSTMAIKAQYQMLGMGSKEATAAAKDLQSKLGGMDRSIRRMAAGMDPLSEDIFELMPEIARVTGKSAQDVYKMVQEGALNPEAFQKQIIDIGKGLKGRDVTRFTETVRGVFGPAGDAIANAISNPGNLKKATDEANKNMAKMDPNKEWEKIMGASKDTFAFHQRLLEANKELLEIQRDFAIKNPFIKALDSQTSALQLFQDKLSDSDSMITKIINGLDAMRLGGISALAAFAGFPSITKIAGGISVGFAFLATLPKTLTIVGRGLQFVKTLGGALLKPFSRLLPTFSSFSQFGSGVASLGTKGVKFAKNFFSVLTRGAGRFLPIIGSIVSFIPDFMDSLKDFKVGNIFKGLGTILLGDVKSSVGSQALKWGGIGATIGSFIVPGLGTLIGGAIGAAVGALAKGIKDHWDSMSSWIGEQAEKIGYWAGYGVAVFQDKFSGSMKWLDDNVFNKQVWIDRGKVIASSMYEAFMSSMKMIDQTLFNQEWWIQKWNSIVEIGKTAFKGLVDWLVSIPDMISEGWKATTGWFGGLLKKFDAGMEEGKKAYKERPVPEIPVMGPSNVAVKPDSEVPLMKPSNVIAFPQDRTKKPADVEVGTKAAPMGPVAPTAAPVISMNQPGAPGKSALGGDYEPTGSSDKSKVDGSFIAQLIDLRSIIEKGLDKLIEKPVTVELQGDAKKFLKEIQNSSRNGAGSRGFQNAVG